jgi:enamine deaminase RidA (YjgF/YER057c/UK114 family)
MSEKNALLRWTARATANARNEARESKIKGYFWLLAVALWIFAGSEGLQAQSASCVADVEGHLKGLGISLPPASPPVANYVPSVRTGNLVFLAGTPSRDLAGNLITGKVGADLTSDQGYQAARLTGIYLLSALKAEIGDLNRVTRVVKVFGMVNADPTFTAHPTVINGVSDLLVAVFGECGRHARSAVGMGSLPFGIAVEIDMVVEVADAAPLFFGPPKLISSEHQDFSGPITSDHPARSGEIIQLYASGLGPVTPPVPDGATAPGSPLSRTVNPVTCGALDASGNMIPLAVLFAGLAPGQTGIYQLNLELPGSLPAENTLQVRCGVGSNNGSIAIPVQQ